MRSSTTRRHAARRDGSLPTAYGCSPERSAPPVHSCPADRPTFSPLPATFGAGEIPISIRRAITKQLASTGIPKKQNRRPGRRQFASRGRGNRWRDLAAEFIAQARPVDPPVHVMLTLELRGVDAGFADV